MRQFLVVAAYSSVFTPEGQEAIPFAKAWVVPAERQQVHNGVNRKNLGQEPVLASVSVDDFGLLVEAGTPCIVEADYDLSEYGGKVKRKLREVVVVDTVGL